MQITAQNTARMKAHGRTGGGRSQGGAVINGSNSAWEPGRNIMP